MIEQFSQHSGLKLKNWEKKYSASYYEYRWYWNNFFKLAKLKKKIIEKFNLLEKSKILNLQFKHLNSCTYAKSKWEK